MEGLQELLNTIRQKESSFPAAQKIVAAYVVKNYESIPFLPITTLADNIGVSERTVIKFCNSIGFDRFAEFKKTLSNYAQSKLVITSKLSKAETKKMQHDIFDITMKQDVDAIKATMSLAENRENLPVLIDMLMKAKHIYVTGGRASAIIARLFANMLRYLNLKVHELESVNGDYYDRLMMVEPGDVVIAISFARYTSQVVEGLNYLNQKGVSVALITDTGLSPAFSSAKVTFHCEAGSEGYFPCYSGCFSLIYAICSELGARKGHKASSHTRELEHLLSEGNIFV